MAYYADLNPDFVLRSKWGGKRYIIRYRDEKGKVEKHGCLGYHNKKDAEAKAERLNMESYIKTLKGV